VADDAAARILAFTELIEGMKEQTRTAWSSGGRRESVAEHSWRLAMLACAVAPHLPGVDQGRLIELCLAHDLGEVFDGDVSAPLQDPAGTKESTERSAVARIAATLGGTAGERLQSLWEEYNAGASPEARAAKALDKIETIIQHNQGANPPDFDYAYNLAYGADLAAVAPVIAEMRRLVDERTASRADSSGA
jgi:putative hydrolases of HD superfamily